MLSINVYRLNVIQCALQYQAKEEIGRYAVAIQIEDFASPTDTIPMSSVPLQFLILVYNSSEPCSSRPELVSSTARPARLCVPFNTSWQETISVRSATINTRFADKLLHSFISCLFLLRIVDIITASPQGLRKSELTQTGNPREWYANVTWIPNESQLGPNIFCYSALDSTG